MANLDLSKTSQDTDIATKVIKDNFIQYIYSTEDNCVNRKAYANLNNLDITVF